MPMPPQARLELKRARLAILQAPLAAGEKPDPNRPAEIAALRDEILILQEETGALFELPPRRDLE